MTPIAAKLTGEQPAMPATKIVDEEEVKRWFADGLTYEEMSRRYREQYHIEMTPTAWGNFRRRRGLQRRTFHDTDLIPWVVRPEHRYKYPLRMLRLEGRVRAGQPLRDEDVVRHRNFLSFLADNRYVVDYRPDDQPLAGFVYAPRRPTDADITRQPATAAVRRSRHAVD